MIPESEKEIIKKCNQTFPGSKTHLEKDGKMFQFVKNDSGVFVWRRIPYNSVKFY